MGAAVLRCHPHLKQPCLPDLFVSHSTVCEVREEHIDCSLSTTGVCMPHRVMRQFGLPPRRPELTSAPIGHCRLSFPCGLISDPLVSANKHGLLRSAAHTVLGTMCKHANRCRCRAERKEVRLVERALTWDVFGCRLKIMCFVGWNVFFFFIVSLMT